MQSIVTSANEVQKFQINLRCKLQIIATVNVIGTPILHFWYKYLRHEM